MTEKKAFMIYLDSAPQWKKLTTEQKGKLIDALIDYNLTGEDPDIDDPVVDIVYVGMKATLDRDYEKYEERCKRNADNARKRWDKKKAVSEPTENTQSSSEMQSHAKHADRDKDIDKDIDSDRERGRNRDRDKKNLSSSSIRKVVEKYIEICKPAQQPTLTKELEANINNALSLYGMDDLIAVFTTVSRTPFLNGQISDWQADLTWIFSNENINKILSGKYREYTRKPTREENAPDMAKYEYFINRIPNLSTQTAM